jgi:hypothetical protein
VVSVSSSHYVLILMKQQSQVETLDLSALYQPLQHSIAPEVAQSAVKTEPRGIGSSRQDVYAYELKFKIVK